MYGGHRGGKELTVLTVLNSLPSKSPRKLIIVRLSDIIRGIGVSLGCPTSTKNKIKKTYFVYKSSWISALHGVGPGVGGSEVRDQCV